MNNKAKFVIFLHEPIETINPNLHGHFAEHLGQLIYPGIYVEPQSAVPNIQGIRKDVVDALKPLGVPVLRWPGGCFADTYNWRDGIGLMERRPRRVNAFWGMAGEPNHFGTHEFVAFCRMIGAEPYFAANVGSGTPGDMRDWIEYCNFSGDSTLTGERRANGADKPFGIRYWGIGNENWGCGGNMTAEQYAAEYRKFQTYAFNYPGSPIEKVACGPDGPNWTWTKGFFDAIAGECKCNNGRLDMVQGFGAHYYAGTSGTATEYSPKQWRELLSKAVAVEGVITGHRAIMDEYDPERKVNLFLDEWGAWHPAEQGKPGSALFQQNTIRDACLAALTLDIFHNHADKLQMANIAQIINVLQALLLVNDERCIKTPTYHVFDLYRPHKGALALRTASEAETISDGEDSKDVCRNCYRDKRFPGLKRVAGSASLNGKRLCATLVNTHPEEETEVELVLRGAAMRNVEKTVLNAADIHYHNTFDNPEKVAIGPTHRLDAPKPALTIILPPGSVTRLMGDIL